MLSRPNRTRDRDKRFNWMEPARPPGHTNKPIWSKPHSADQSPSQTVSADTTDRHEPALSGSGASSLDQSRGTAAAPWYRRRTTTTAAVAAVRPARGRPGQVTDLCGTAPAPTPRPGWDRSRRRRTARSPRPGASPVRPARDTGHRGTGSHGAVRRTRRDGGHRARHRRLTHTDRGESWSLSRSHKG